MLNRNKVAVDDRFDPILRIYIATVAVLTSCVGLAAVAGWTLDVAWLRGDIAGQTGVRAMAAVEFILAGIVLYLLNRPTRGTRERSVITVSSFVLAGIALIAVGQYLFGVELLTDDLFLNSASEEASAYTSRIAPQAAVCFVLCGLAMLNPANIISQVFVVVCLLIQSLVIIGYIFNTSLFYQPDGYYATTLLTALVFILFLPGIAIVQRESFIRQLLFTDKPGGKSLRRMLPASIVLPVVAGWLIEQSVGLGYLSAHIHTSVLVVLLIAVYSASLVYVIQRDSTHRRRAEDSFRHEEQKLRLIFNSLSEGVALNEIVYDDNGEMIDYRILEVNDAYYKAATYTDNVVGRLATELYGMTTDSINTFWKQHRNETKIVVTEMYELRDNRCYYITTSPFVDNRFVTSFFDITHQKEAETTLRQSEERYKHLLESLTDAVFVLDSTLRFIIANTVGAELAGIRHEQLIGTTLAEAFPNLLDSGFYTTLNEVFATQKAATLTGRYDFADKSGWYEFCLYPAPEGVVCLITDISARIAAEAEKTLQSAALNNAANAIVITDVTGTIQWANPAYEKLTGYSIEFAVGKNSRILNSGVHPPEFYQHLWSTISSGMVWHSEIINKRKDGSYYYEEETITPVHDALGAITHFIAIKQDITGRKSLEKQLRQIIEHQRGILDSALDCIITINANGIITEFNPAAEATFGYSRMEAIGSRLDERIIPLQYRQRHQDAFNKYLSTNTGTVLGKRLELSAMRSDGTEFPVELTITKIESSGEHEFTGFIRDITAKKLAEESLRQSEELFRLITEHVPDLISVRDITGKWIYTSPSFFTLFQPETLAPGLDSFEIVHPDDRERIRNGYYDSIATGKSVFSEYRIIASNGSVRQVECQGFPIQGTDGKAVSMLCITRDVTEKKLAQVQQLRAQRMESIGTLAGGIAHDLNNILTPIMLSLEILGRKATDDLTKQTIVMLENVTKRGADLIKQVLAFARGTPGEHIALQPGHIIGEIVKIIRETFPKSINVTFKYPSELPVISADPTQIHQVLMNLCVNARDAMPNGGTIEITAAEVVIDEQYSRMHADALPGNFLHIGINDKGAGIPPEVVDRIFEPFYTTKELGQGTGLGLSTVLSIIKSHKGFITVYSEIGKGTLFNVYLPANREANLEAVEKRTDNVGGKETILVVDDEASILEVTVATLESHGYTVMQATNGVDAVKMFSQHINDIALVISDIAMPMMDGKSTIRAMRHIRPSVKVLAVSGLRHHEDGLDIPFLHKPYSSAMLLDKVAELLRQR